MPFAADLYRCRHPLGFGSRWVLEHTELSALSLLCFEGPDRSVHLKPRKAILISSILAVQLTKENEFRVTFKDSAVRAMEWRAESSDSARNWVDKIQSALDGEFVEELDNLTRRLASKQKSPMKPSRSRERLPTPTLAVEEVALEPATEEKKPFNKEAAIALLKDFAQLNKELMAAYEVSQQRVTAFVLANFVQILDNQVKWSLSDNLASFRLGKT
jgi:hypothetical protein